MSLLSDPTLPPPRPVSTRLPPLALKSRGPGLSLLCCRSLESRPQAVPVFGCGAANYMYGIRLRFSPKAVGTMSFPRPPRAVALAVVAPGAIFCAPAGRAILRADRSTERTARPHAARRPNRSDGRSANAERNHLVVRDDHSTTCGGTFDALTSRSRDDWRYEKYRFKLFIPLAYLSLG